MLSFDLGSGLWGWAAAGVTAAILGGVVYWQSGKLDKAREAEILWKQTAQTNAETVTALTARRVALDKALLERESEIDVLRASMASSLQQLRSAAHESREVSDWGNTRVPDGVLRILRQDGIRYANGAGTGTHSGSSPDGSGNPGADGRYKQ